MNKFDVAIIGQGIIGQAIAYKFILEGKKVAVFDRGDQNSGTRAAQSIISMKGATQARAPLFRAKLQGHTNFPNWIGQIANETGSTSLRAFVGAIELFRSESEFQKLLERAIHGESLGLRKTEVLSKSELKGKKFLETDSGICGGIHFTDDCHINPTLLTSLLYEFIQKHARTMNDLTDASFENSRWSLNCGDQEILAQNLVLAAGPWTNEVLKMTLGTYVPMVEAPGTTMWFRNSRKIETGTLLLHGKMGLSCFENICSFGATSENSVGIDHEQICLQLKKNALENLEGISVLESDLSELHYKRGVRVRTSSRFPRIGFVGEKGDEKRVIVATGFYKSGFQLASIVANSVWNLTQSPSVIDDFVTESNFQNAK